MQDLSLPYSLSQHSRMVLNKRISESKSDVCGVEEHLLLAYEGFVRSRFKMLPSQSDDMLHAALGIAGEAGEIIDAIKKPFAYNQLPNQINIIEELGDLLFYIQAMANTMDIKLSEIMMANAAKLTLRYPQGYDDAAAIARADKTEGEI